MLSPQLQPLKLMRILHIVVRLVTKWIPRHTKMESGDSIVCSFSTTATTANGVAYFRHKLHAVCQDTQYANNLGRRSADLMSSTYTYTEIETRL